ncbi:tRNA (guanosine(46)-N7)-methyltransferase TrmB [Buchnera aphidicola]|uniref:tRNA (guanosine(46)-N7)-methyltransferase TrmB n=1 Tax=Buchnera aphidicola TaxID=9 RepID=UPI0034644DC8
MKYKLVNNLITPTYNINHIFLRQVRSFVCRNRKLKKNDIYFFKKYWPSIGINFKQEMIDLNNLVYKNNFPLIVEIGFGNGDSLLHTASSNLDRNILGIEVHISGIISCMKKIYISNIKNIKIIAHDAVEVLKYMILDHTLHTIQFFFPDPWPKFRHHKRRIFNYSFIKLLLKKLMFGGLLHIVTDSASYAQSILKIMNDAIGYVNISKNSTCMLMSPARVVTNFEKKALFLKQEIFELFFRSIQK